MNHLETPLRAMRLCSVILPASVILPLLGLLSACTSDAENGSTGQAPDLTTLCEELSPTQLPHEARITSRETKTGRDFDLDVCVIRGEIVSSPESTVLWAVELPSPSAWNGKSLTVGGGGFDGFIPTDADFPRWYSGKPYARFSSDAGHQVRSFMPWGMDDIALQNHGYLANHMTLEIGTQIATQFYGKSPSRRYMIGISNGGRAGLVAAERYPEDYDGIVALAPAINQQSHQLGMIELMSHIFASEDNWMSPDDVKLFMNAEIEACDGLDGLEDGIIHNFQACSYDAADLECVDEKTDACLTAGQIESIALIYQDHSYPFSLADGLPASYPKFGRGGAPSGDWVDYLFGPKFEDRAPFNFFAADQAVKVVEGNDGASAMDHDAGNFEAEWQRLSTAIDPTSHDMSTFKQNGGKLLVWYPAGDACVSIYRFAQYYDALQDSMGESAVQDFSRFYVSPALGHVFVGPGANAVDYLDKLDVWVEQQQAPDGHVAAKIEDGNSSARFARPVCEYPAYPHYDGNGDPDSAESFRCIVDQ